MTTIDSILTTLTTTLTTSTSFTTSLRPSLLPSSSSSSTSNNNNNNNLEQQQQQQQENINNLFSNPSPTPTFMSTITPLISTNHFNNSNNSNNSIIHNNIPNMVIFDFKNSDVKTYYKCSLCLDIEIESNQLIQHLCGNDYVCKTCFENYLESKISSAYNGSCPIITCPLCPPSSKQITFSYDVWSSAFPTIAQKYITLAKSLLSIQCASCHSRRTLFIDPISDTSNTHTLLQSYFQNLDNYNDFSKCFENFQKGNVTINEFYSQLNEYIPAISYLEDKESWERFKTILQLIINPERRANLHLRYLRLRPRAYLTCCNREQCFRCRTRDMHDGKTCEEMTLQHDNGLVQCSQCNVYLVKGDGCDTVTCVCGKQFSWSGERQRYDSSRAFQDLFPTNTAEMYARVICDINGSSLCDLRIADSWATTHEMESYRALLNWWNLTYSLCPAQCSILQNIQLTNGGKKSKKIWQQAHSNEVEKCYKQREFAILSLIKTYYPVNQFQNLKLFFEWYDNQLNIESQNLKELLNYRLSTIDKSFLDESIQLLRVMAEKQYQDELLKKYQEEEEKNGNEGLDGLVNLFFDPNDNDNDIIDESNNFFIINNSIYNKNQKNYSNISTKKLPKVSQSELQSYIIGARQFLHLYGNYSVKFGNIEIKLIEDERNPSFRGGKKYGKRHHYFKGTGNPVVMQNGRVLCRWYHSKSLTSENRTFYRGYVTKFRSGTFDLTFTDDNGNEFKLGGLVYRSSFTSDSSLYLPKYIQDNNSAEWHSYYLPSIPLNNDQLQYYRKFCQCLRYSDLLYDHEYSKFEVDNFVDRSRISRAIVPIMKLIEEKPCNQNERYSTNSTNSDVNQKRTGGCFNSENDWGLTQKLMKKEKRKLLDDAKRSEKVVWKELFRAVMWKSSIEGERRKKSTEVSKIKNNLL